MEESNAAASANSQTGTPYGRGRIIPSHDFGKIEPVDLYKDISGLTVKLSIALGWAERRGLPISPETIPSLTPAMFAGLAAISAGGREFAALRAMARAQEAAAPAQVASPAPYPPAFVVIQPPPVPRTGGVIQHHAPARNRKFNK